MGEVPPGSRPGRSTSGVETMARALVTGGAGFIGSHLVRALKAEGWTVRIVDDLSTGKRANVEGLELELFVRDLASEPVEDLVKGMDAVFHLAAVGSVPRSVVEPLRSHHAAATATLRLLIAARDAGVGRFVNSSSSSVYGDVAAPPMRESMPTAPRSPYAVAKLAAEGYTRVFAQLYGQSTVTLRYFNVFGPRQDPSSAYAAAIPRFVSAYLRHAPPTVYGDGHQSRDFTYVENVVRANLLASRAPRLVGQSLNIAAGRPVPVLEILDRIADVFGYRTTPSFEPERPGDVRDSHADIALAREVLGYEPTVDLATGLTRTIDWLRETHGIVS